ncbi:structural maintenance of chromosomes protein 3-like [Periplaneta americana]|uniref:structural maintenance of chromosomes protein 3-like n=1 Tax=Periplaneta americana TaxID=6978 RepID=UPI0037E7E489
MKPFHRSLNVIVGENDSGKANVLYAIQFVLSDEFSPLNQTLRKSLLQQSHCVLSASVEIIFNNMDKQFPVRSKNPVSIKRQIGASYDRYYLNDKTIKREDLMAMFMSAGFSSCNVYHIVKQGKVNQLAICTDEDRLRVLLDISGANMYDDETHKSENTVNEVSDKLRQAKALLRVHTKKLEMLAEQKEKLERRKNLERSCLFMEYCLYHKKLKELKEALKALEESCAPSFEMRSKQISHQIDIQVELSNTTTELESIENCLDELQLHQHFLRAEQEKIQNYSEETKLKILTLTEEQSTFVEQKIEKESKLENLELRMKENEQSLEDSKITYEECKTKEEEYTKRLLQLKQKRDFFYDRVGNHFESEEERNLWLQKELRSIDAAMEEVDLKESIITEELHKNEEQENKLKNEIKNLQETESEHLQIISTTQKRLYDTTKIILEGESFLSELSRAKADLKKKHSFLLHDVKTKKFLCSLVDKNIILGLDGVNGILKNMQESEGVDRISGYFGTVTDNVECQDALLTAVEATAGERLFHHIVANMNLCFKIIKEFNRSDLPGEINFLILQQLKVKHREYPITNDALPLITKLNYAEDYNKVMSFIFGKTLLCRNLETAMDFAGICNMNCVDLDGLQIFSSGLLLAGHVDKSKSVILEYGKYSSQQQLMKSSEKEIQRVERKIRKAEDKLNKLANDKEKDERELVRMKNELQEMRLNQDQLTDVLNQISDATTKRNNSLNQLQTTRDVLLTRKTALEMELSHEMVSQLSESEQEEMVRLIAEIREVTLECEKVSNERLKLEYDTKLSRKIALAKDHEALLKTLVDLERDDEEAKRLLESHEMTLNSVLSDFDIIKKEITENEAIIEETKKKQELLRNELKKLKEKEKGKQKQKRLKVIDEEIEVLLTKKNGLLTEIRECIKRMHALEKVPPGAFASYENMGVEQLTKRLKDVRRELNKCSKIDERVHLHYESISSKVEEKRRQLAELVEGYDGILELKDTIQAKKNEAIHLTLESTSDSFSQIFKRLVPAGHAYLLMKTTGGESVPIESVTDVATIRGVGITVSFDAKEIELQDIQETSKSQKSLLAVTLIFAILKASPVPVCAMADVDSMLDDIYKPNLAQLMSDFSESTQFIVTTHDENIVRHANKVFGIVMDDQASRIQHIREEQD